MHINYILVIGEEEEKSGSVAVRNYKTKEQSSEELDLFIERIEREIQDKSL
jgi:threonyl-tRNA synthetase